MTQPAIAAAMSVSFEHREPRAHGLRQGWDQGAQTKADWQTPAREHDFG